MMMMIVMLMIKYKTNVCHKCATLIRFTKDDDDDNDDEDEDI